MHRIILMGKQGTGKGTQANLLKEKLGIVHISTGDVFRAALKNETPAGLLAKQYINNGNLVPDDATNKIVKEFFESNPDALDNFVLDGYPRNKNQALFLEDFLGDAHPIQKLIVLDANTDVIIDRISGRRVCDSCGSIFQASEIKENLECSKCGGNIYQREDDYEEAVLKRVKIYEEETKPLIDFYSSKISVEFLDADCEVEELFEKIKSTI